MTSWLGLHVMKAAYMMAFTGSAALRATVCIPAGPVLVVEGKDWGRVVYVCEVKRIGSY